MAARTRRSWKPQRDGQYVRQLGWKRGADGTLTQPKFRLGTDLREAKRREMMLTYLWEDVERQSQAEPLTWPAEALEIAKQIARSGRVRVPRREGEPEGLYASRVVAMAERLPKIPLLPGDEGAFRRGVESQSESMNELIELHEAASGAVHQHFRRTAAKWGDPPGGPAAASGPSMHEALRDHIEWLKAEYSDSDGNLTSWGRAKVKQVETLLDRHDDMPLARLDHDAIEGMVRFWRQRPPRKGAKQPIAKKSAEHQIAALKSFLRWLSRSSTYDWTKPASFDDIRARIGTRADDLADAYPTRPFGKVFRAIQAVEAHLKPMFEAAGDAPFG